MKSIRKKAFILGIDGATFDIINPLVANDKMPNMKKVIEGGVHGILHSTVPPLSAPAWVAFMTGKNPGHYGTFHFRKISIESSLNMFNLELISSSAYRGDTFFDYLGKNGHKVGIMTVPVTYPPWEVNGFLVSGYPCPDPNENSNFTFPLELSGELPENLNWTEDINSNIIPKEELRGASDPQDVLEGGRIMMTRRTEYTLKLMNKYDTELTILVWGAIDRAQHMLWKYHDPGHILHQPNNEFSAHIEKLYCHADRLLGQIMARIGPETPLFIISDHGFGSKQGSRFHLNAWLNYNGYLKSYFRAKFLNNLLINKLKPLIRKLAGRLDAGSRKKLIKANRALAMSAIDFNKTLAFMYPIDEQTMGLVINLRGRQPKGIVSEKEYDSLRNEIIEKLEELQNSENDKRVLKNCYKREELFCGSKTVEAPDIILELAEGYYSGLKSVGKFFSQIPFGQLNEISGTHRAEGIFIGCGPDLSRGKILEKANIIDVAPTVLYSLNEKIPVDIEGEVIRSAFSEHRLKKAPEYIDREVVKVSDEAEASEAEQLSMAKKLKELGYL
jgi:predicted AlkP superfamily phosphohydrolase/phosphomutase